MAPSPLELRFESPDFPCDRIQVREIRGRERISRLFDIELLLAVPSDELLEPRTLIGALGTIIFHQSGVERRRVAGMIIEAIDLMNTDAEFRGYRLRLFPRASRLELVRTQEIFMGLSLQQIIEEKLGLVGLEKEAVFALRGADEPREFVVQYDETDLAFISRLTEHAGWSFYIDSSEGRDLLVFTDHNDGFALVRGGEKIDFRPRGERRDVYRFEAAARAVPAVAGVYDYNYRTPLVQLASSLEVAGGYAGGVLEYGTNFDTPAQGEVFARIRSEEHAARSFVYEGEADLCTIAAGARVWLLGHPRLGDKELLVVNAKYEASQITLGSSGGTSETSFKVVFEAIDVLVPYRPPRVTHRPRIMGVTPGIVESAPGIETESAWIDNQGRYLVRMLFDTAQPGERQASLPIRMAQAHAGPGYGIHHPLRPGTEVLVAFIGGDPDRPVIVGAVPNAVTPTPVVDREANMHRMKTWSGVTVEIDDGG